MSKDLICYPSKEQAFTDSRTNAVHKQNTKSPEKGQSAGNQDIVTTSITIPASLFKAGKMRAEQQFRSFSQYIRNLVNQDIMRASHPDSKGLPNCDDGGTKPY